MISTSASAIHRAYGRAYANSRLVGPVLKDVLACLLIITNN